MWTRSEIKEKAKAELKQSYWLSLAVCFLTGIIAGGSTSISFSGGGSSLGGSLATITENTTVNEAAIIALVTVLVGLMFIVIIVSFAYGIFVANPVTVGKNRFFTRAPQEERDIGNLFYAFKEGRYLPTVKAMFITYLHVFLWTLLFIIPGIIKAYEYYMVPYILADDPTLTAGEAMAKSKIMTDGEKFSIFILQWSFFGWYFLGMLALGIGVLFVQPYAEATYAQLYLLLKERGELVG